MEIIIARNSGFCYGVKRALRLTRETVKKNQSRIFTWGELIHNPEVISDLEKEALRLLLPCPGSSQVIQSLSAAMAFHPQFTGLSRKRK